MAIVTMKHVGKLPRHCTSGVERWLSRVDMTIPDVVAGNLTTERLREIGGFSALKLAEIAEQDAAEQDEAGGNG